MQMFDVIDSTQIEAKRQIDLKQIIVEDVLLANKQTSGVTTKEGIPWISCHGDLTLSMIFNIETLLKNGNISINHIPFCVGIAMYDELFKVKKQSKSNFDILLKWPNDWLIKKEDDEEYRKIGGVMCNDYKGHFIIGVSCNLISHPVKTQHFPATDLLSFSGIKLDNIKLAESLVKNIKINLQKLQSFGFNFIKQQWKKHAYMIGKRLVLNDNNVVIFNDITDEGYIYATKNGDARIVISSDEVIGGENKIY